MSDKTVGIIGQTYEDRKTGKCGVLESRDDKYKTLMFRAEDGTTFSISNSSFRSNWRKAKDDTVNPEPVEEESVAEEEVQEEVTESVDDVEAEETEPEVKPKKRKAKVEKKSVEPAPVKNYDGITNAQAIATFLEAIMSERPVEVTNETDCLTILVDGLVVITIRDIGNEAFNLAMLPDVFTLTDWRGKLHTYSIQYKPGAENHLGVVVDTKQTCIPEILDIITESVKDINLYGYMEEEEE